MAVEKIDQLLISTTERGSQDHKSFLASYRVLDEYLTENNIPRPVVILSDGHSYSFDFDVLSFLQEKQMRLFLSPPYTTGLLLLLDQVNKNLHLEYKNAKDSLITNLMTINRESFMIILANMWGKWSTKESIVKAAKRGGVTSTELSVEFMQQNKFLQAAICIEGESSGESSGASSLPTSPAHRKGSAACWKAKFNQSQELIQNLNEKSISLEEVPGLMTIEKVKLKLSKTTRRVTQVHGSMQGKEVLKMVESIKKKKDEEQKIKEDKIQKQENERRLFHLCKLRCVCQQGKCAALGLKECPHCHSILRSVCSNAACVQDGKKPVMIMPDAAATKKCVRKPLFHGIELDESEKSSDEDDDDAENETELDDGESDSEVESDEISAALKE